MRRHNIKIRKISKIFVKKCLKKCLYTNSDRTIQILVFEHALVGIQCKNTKNLLIISYSHVVVETNKSEKKLYVTVKKNIDFRRSRRAPNITPFECTTMVMSYKIEVGNPISLPRLHDAWGVQTRMRPGRGSAESIFRFWTCAARRITPTTVTAPRIIWMDFVRAPRSYHRKTDKPCTCKWNDRWKCRREPRRRTKAAYRD